MAGERAYNNDFTGIQREWPHAPRGARVPGMGMAARFGVDPRDGTAWFPACVPGLSQSRVKLCQYLDMPLLVHDDAPQQCADAFIRDLADGARVVGDRVPFAFDV